MKHIHIDYSPIRVKDNIIIETHLQRADLCLQAIRDRRPFNDDELKTISDFFRTPLTCTSGAIEGCTFTMGETQVLLQYGITVHGKSLKETLEVYGLCNTQITAGHRVFIRFGWVNRYSGKIQIKYFDVTFYKKGTCHIEFRNEELLKKLNIFGSQQKGWLPPGYGKKAYQEMGEEERAVIDEFEGEISYQNTVNNANYYIYDSQNLILLEAV